MHLYLIKVLNNGKRNLSGNGEMFKGLVSLTSLNIRRFKSLRLIDTGAFQHLSSTLEKLSMGDNSIEIIETGAFKCLSKLRNLGLSGNQLTEEQLDHLEANEEFPLAAEID
jgi:Leucine-rich repeat (LRR) protein